MNCWFFPGVAVAVSKGIFWQPIPIQCLFFFMPSAKYLKIVMIFFRLANPNVNRKITPTPVATTSIVHIPESVLSSSVQTSNSMTAP